MEPSTLAREQFEHAIHNLYRQYIFDEDARRQKPSQRNSDVRIRGIREILERYPPSKPPDEIRTVLHGFGDVENLLKDYGPVITSIVRDSPSQTRFTLWWVGEEALHGAAIEEYLMASGAYTQKEINDNFRAATAAPWEPIRHNPHFAEVWYGAICYVAVQELITQLSYQNFTRPASACGQTALKLILQRLASEEARHHVFYRSVAELALSFDPERLIHNLTLVCQEFAMPGKFAGLPYYDEWTKVAQDLGIVADARFAYGRLAREEKGRVMSVETAEANAQRISCWDNYVAGIRGIFRNLRIPFPEESLPLLKPIPVPATYKPPRLKPVLTPA